MNRVATIDAGVAGGRPSFSAEARDEARRLIAHFRFVGLVGDILVVFFSLAFASWLRFATRLSGYGIGAQTIDWRDYLGPVLFGTVLFLFLLPHRDLYDPQWILRFRSITRRILRTGVVWLVAFAMLAWLLRTRTDVSRVYVLLAFSLTTASMLAWRYGLYCLMTAEAVTGRLGMRVLFVGWSSSARILAQTILRDARHPYELVGYVPWRDEAEDDGRAVFLRRLGGADDVASLLGSGAVDLVVLADTDAPADVTVALANLCEQEMVDFKVIATCSQILCSCLSLQTVSGVPVLGVSSLPLANPISALFKQLGDELGAIVGLILAAPVIALFAWLVYRESPGPVFYRQRRVGEHGRMFWLYKIRSMRLDAEREGQVGWTVRDDPRRLRIGAFMRRWNIDELPQFWNVLRGDMSLVGPRPERPELIRRFKEEIVHYNARHSIKPGITGWAQVNGFRGDTDLRERLQYDLYYIENWSPLLDLQILVLTLFRHKNAG